MGRIPHLVYFYCEKDINNFYFLEILIMTSADIEVYIKLFNTLGLPIILLVLGLYGFYKIVMFILPKVLALVERYIDDNHRLVEHLSSNSVKTLELLDKLEDSITKVVIRLENKI